MKKILIQHDSKSKFHVPGEKDPGSITTGNKKDCFKTQKGKYKYSVSQKIIFSMQDFICKFLIPKNPSLKPKKGHMNYYECCDLTKKYI